MSFRAVPVSLLSMLALICLFSNAKAQKKWTIEDVLRAEAIKLSEISPDGEYVFYQTSKSADGYPAPASGFYAVKARGEEIHALDISLGVHSIDIKRNLCKWSPDSREISYLSRDSSRIMQVWGISRTGGKPRQITNSIHAVNNYSWSAGGQQVLFVTNEPDSPEHLAHNEEWGVVVSPEEPTWARRQSIWVENVVNGNLVRIAHSVQLHGEPEWSPDGKEVAFLASDTVNDMPDLFTVPAAGGRTPKAVTESKVGVRFFSWSPDGHTIGYVEAKRDSVPYVNYHDGAGLLPGSIWVYDNKAGVSTNVLDLEYPQLSRFAWSRGGGQLVFIAQSPEFAGTDIYSRYIPLNMYVLSLADRNVRSVASGMEFFLGGEFITWSDNDEEIWFTNGEGVGYNLFACHVSTGYVKHVTSGKDRVNHVSFSADFGVASFVSSSISKKPEVYVSPTLDWAPQAITDLNPWVRDYENEYEEVVSYKSDGWDIEGLVVKPANFDPTKKYPLLVITHGGPNWFKLNEWCPDWEQYPLKLYAAEGYVVFFPNFRGSANYGADFIKTTHQDLGRQDVRDVLRGVDFLVEQGYVDEDRMGICGWSYGGFITPAIITQTDRFKAAQFGAGLPSIEAMYASLRSVERILHRSFDARPWENGAMHIQYSPLYHAHKVKTPTLIQHGEEDPVCPVGGAVLFYKALKSYGIPTVLEIYPEMGHSITDPTLFRRVLTKNLEWFNKWLKGDKHTSFDAKVHLGEEGLP